MRSKCFEFPLRSRTHAGNGPRQTFPCMPTNPHVGEYGVIVEYTKFPLADRASMMRCIQDPSSVGARSSISRFSARVRMMVSIPELPPFSCFYSHRIYGVAGRFVDSKDLRHLLRLLGDVGDRKLLSDRIGEIRQMQQPCRMAAGGTPHGCGIGKVVRVRLATLIRRSRFRNRLQKPLNSSRSCSSRGRFSEISRSRGTIPKDARIMRWTTKLPMPRSWRPATEVHLARARSRSSFSFSWTTRRWKHRSSIPFNCAYTCGFIGRRKRSVNSARSVSGKRWRNGSNLRRSSSRQMTRGLSPTE